MYKIHFYTDRNGKSPVLDYIKELSSQDSKSARINSAKIAAHIAHLQEFGLKSPGNKIKHLDGEIWELRPLRNRILFAAWYKDGFILLHCFVKKTQKTPPQEIEKAKRELADISERSSANE